MGVQDAAPQSPGVIGDSPVAMILEAEAVKDIAVVAPQPRYRPQLERIFENRQLLKSRRERPNLPASHWYR